MTTAPVGSSEPEKFTSIIVGRYLYGPNNDPYMNLGDLMMLRHRKIVEHFAEPLAVLRTFAAIAPGSFVGSVWKPRTILKHHLFENGLLDIDLLKTGGSITFEQARQWYLDEEWGCRILNALSQGAVSSRSEFGFRGLQQKMAVRGYVACQDGSWYELWC